MPGLQMGGPFFQPPQEPPPPEGEVPGWATAEAGYPGATTPEEVPTEPEPAGPEQPAEPEPSAEPDQLTEPVAADSARPVAGEVSG
ncbi:hypothetical protein IU459_01910 [Nocardia amamiensis]|uniref:Uncharacterized protein n=1 Tax=Nocardia amamiensis TaxID=404578 RepID=A0ABS0CI71_9NOCA|nr:hypothetical protein [Nocardia amamiensis]MBF6296296.1 hypothetical protein [Nocardia amamiensis]